MLQFYLLSIIANIVAGLALSIDFFVEKFPSLEKIKVITNSSTFKISVGAVSVIIGLFKLLTVTPGDVPFIGDLFPAIAGLVCGAALIADYYKEKATVASNLINKIDVLILKNKSIYGTGAIAIAIIHFFFPGVLFL